MKRKKFIRRLESACEKNRRRLASPFKRGLVPAPRYRTSGTIRFETDDREWCPLTLVCWSETGEFVNHSDFHRAAKKLGMKRKLASKIAKASDRTAWVIRKGKKKEADELIGIRRDMLEAIHL